MKGPALVVDRKGLAKKLEHKPKAFILYELLQNALDEDTSLINVTAEMLPGKPVCQVTVEDDAPEGFADIRSIYTMFRDSKKGKDPTKRGRFELGEKLVIALSQYLEVSTTKGTIIIDGDNRSSSRAKRDRGSKVTLRVKMNREEFAEMNAQVHSILMPTDKVVRYNGSVISPRKAIDSVEATLPTIIADEDGVLKPSTRKTVINIYSVKHNEVAYLYEMGIPVVETGDKFHYDVQQRVPVNWERSNVPPAYLKKLRAAVLDSVSDILSNEDVTESWVQSSLSDVGEAAVKNVLDRQYGTKRVIYDPSDPEGNKRAVAQGYTVIPGRAFSKDIWKNIKDTGAALPAGQVTPSPKPYSNNPDAEVEKLIDEEKWTDDMRRIASLVVRLGDELLDTEVAVRFTLAGGNFAAAFGRGSILGISGATLAFNYRRLGKAWFTKKNTDERLLSLIIHEFGHFYSSDHLSSEYHDALCDLGARFDLLMMRNPGVLSV